MGNAEADAAADLGRRHQSEVLTCARRKLLKARSYWHPIMLDLHPFMVAGYLSTMMAGAVLPLIPLFGIRVVGRKLASLLSGLMWTLPLFPTLLVS